MLLKMLKICSTKKSFKIKENILIYFNQKMNKFFTYNTFIQNCI